MLRAIRLNRSMILLGLILVCAAVVRIGWPGFAEFKYDEAMISRRSIALAQHGIWPASTISSIPGIPQPPIKALLLAIPYAFTRNPMVAVAFQGLLGTLTVGLAYLVGARYFDRRAGLIAAAVLAITPWALFYDRKLWSQDVPVVTCLMMFGLFLAIIERKRWGLVLAAGGLGLLIGFYLGDAILAGVVGLGACCFPRRVFVSQPGEGRWRPGLWAGGAAVVLAITLLPYAVELGQRQTSPSALSEAVGETAPRPFDPIGQIKMSAQVATGFDFHALAGDKAAQFDDSLILPDLNVPLDGTARWVFVLALLYIAIRAILEALRGREASIAKEEPVRRTAPYVLLALWLFVPIAAWTVFRQMPYPHRYIMAFPSQAIALGVMLSDAWGWVDGRWPRYRLLLPALTTAGIVVLNAWHAVLFFGMIHFVETNPIVGGHGVPVERIWAAASRARDLSGPDHLPVVIHTSGDDPEYQGGAAEFDALLGDLPLCLVRTPGIDVLPLRDFVWLHDQGNGKYTVEKRIGVPTSSEAGLARHSNGIDLLSVETAEPSPGQSKSIVLNWRVWNQPPAGRDFGFTAQLVGLNGETLGQVDTPFLRSVYWRTGDTITTRVYIPINVALPPDAPLKLVVAMYAYVSETQIAPVDILDIAGNPAGQNISITLK